MQLTYKRAPVSIQILYLRMARGKNCLDFQIPVILRLSATRWLLLKINIAVDFSVRTNFHVHFLFICDKCFSISTPLRSQLSQTSSPPPRLSFHTDATLPLSSLR